jgi:DNA-binding transcriptional ArsR family regulator
MSEPNASVEGVLDALGDPTRRRIVALLANGPQSVGALAEQLPVSRPAVSQQLRVLKAADLVDDEAQGTRRVYRLTPGGLEHARAYFELLWTNQLGELKRVAEGAD